METKIAFVGDICLNEFFLNFYSLKTLVSEEVRYFIEDSDYCVGNVEGPVFSEEENFEKPGEFCHHSEQEAARFLSNLGINIWNLANNHIFDYHDIGIERTIENCKEEDCLFFGVYKNHNKIENPLIINRNGGIGMISLSYTERKMDNYNGDYRYIDWNNLTQIKRIIESTKKICRWCVVISHGGEEFANIPLPKTRKRYRQYLKFGADIVVAHHPHVVQCYECIENKIIFYSLGNFMFDTKYERMHKHTDIGEIVTIKFGDSGFTWEGRATKINRKEKTLDFTINPITFHELKMPQYIFLWPFSARAFLEEEKKSLIYLEPKYYFGAKKARWIKREMGLIIRRKEYREIVFGKYFSYILLFSSKKKQKLIEYILE